MSSGIHTQIQLHLKIEMVADFGPILKKIIKTVYHFQLIRLKPMKDPLMDTSVPFSLSLRYAMFQHMLPST